MKLTLIEKVFGGFIVIFTILTVARFFAHAFQEPLAGYDRNNNGVRDDVEKFIDRKILDRKNRIHAYRLARSMQQAVIHPDTEPLKPTIFRVSCLMQHMDASIFVDELQAQVANTFERQKAYIHWGARFTDSIFPTPANLAEACGE